MCTFEEGQCKEWLDADKSKDKNKRKYKIFDDVLNFNGFIRNFKIANNPTPSMFTGPRIDRTTKSEFGSFLYSRGSELDPGDVRNGASKTKRTCKRYQAYS